MFKFSGHRTDIYLDAAFLLESCTTNNLRPNLTRVKDSMRRPMATVLWMELAVKMQHFRKPRN